MKLLRVIWISILSTALCLEIVARFDPFGLLASLHNLEVLNTAVAYRSVDDYDLKPGFYQFQGWSMTADTDGHRVIPDNHQAVCQVAILGDSEAMGWGVSDDQTWVNLVARQLPDVHLINTGIFGYRIETIYAEYLKTPADAYLYLMVENDAASNTWQPFNRTFFVSEAVETADILQIAQINIAEAVDDQPGFKATWQKLQRVPNLVTVAYDDNKLAHQAGGSIIFIPHFTGFVSAVDRHANAAGSQEIARAILPILQALQRQHCTF